MSNFQKNFETEIVDYDRGDMLASIVPLLEDIAVNNASIQTLLAIEQKKREFRDAPAVILLSGASVNITPLIDAKRIIINDAGGTSILSVSFFVTYSPANPYLTVPRSLGIKNLLTGNIQATIITNGLYEVTLPRIATSTDYTAVRLTNSGAGSATCTVTWCGE